MKRKRLTNLSCYLYRMKLEGVTGSFYPEPTTKKCQVMVCGDCGGWQIYIFSPSTGTGEREKRASITKIVPESEPWRAWFFGMVAPSQS